MSGQRNDSRHRSLYRGTCGTCNRTVTAELEVTDPAGPHQGVIPPPGLQVSCPSGHSMVLNYQGSKP